MSEPSKTRIRILHAVGGMRRGGVETWLMHLLRRIDRERYQMDFLVHTADECDYDRELRRLGSSVHYCRSPRNPLQYAGNFRRILREHGPYQVVHSHLHHFSGYVLKLAHGAGVPVRIAHSHNTEPAAASTARAFYQAVCHRWMRAHATHLLGVSKAAGENLFGPEWSRDARGRVLSCGLDFSRFFRLADAKRLRPALGLGESDFVIGHVGRFDPQKNHEFLLQVARTAMAMDERVKLLLVGEGKLKPVIEQRAQELGIAGRVIFAGSREDVADLMLGAMDVFAFPSLWEGLGLAPIEAQVAGLPVVMSTNVPADAVWRPDLVQSLALSDAVEWSRTLLGFASRRARPAADDCPFNIQRNLDVIAGLYGGETAQEACPVIQNSPLLAMADLATFLWLLYWAVVASKDLIAGKRHTVSFVLLVLFAFNAVPLLLDVVAGQPEYTNSRWFRIAVEDPAASFIYCCFLSICAPMLWVYGRTKNLARLTLRRKMVTRWIAGQRWTRVGAQLLMLAPIVAVCFAPNAGDYLSYAATLQFTFSKAATNYQAYLSILCMFATIGAAFLIVAARNKLVMILYVLPWQITACWINGKRHSVLLAMLTMLASLWLSRALTRRGLILVSTAATILFAGYALWYQANYREATKQSSSWRYENFRVDYGRDHATKLALYSELNPDQIQILPARFETMLFYATLFLKRESWPEKPWPYAVYFTSAALDLPPQSLGWGFTTSCFDEALSNLGWIGLAVSPLLVGLICKVGDGSGNPIVRALTLLVASLLLVVQLSAFWFLALFWFVAVIWSRRMKTNAHHRYA